MSGLLSDLREWAEQLPDYVRTAGAFDDDLRKYNQLACASHFGLNDGSVGELLYKARTTIERWVGNKLVVERSTEETLGEVFSGNVFGETTKQGPSFRLALWTCMPTRMCREKCYAHDGKDVLRPAIVRGVKNSLIATWYEYSSGSKLETAVVARKEIEERLIPHLDKALIEAVLDMEKARGWGFRRHARIRFASVGDLGCFPNFANFMARLVRDRSEGQVVPVIYTRHKYAHRLDPELWCINFSLDPSSRERVGWAPERSRITYACFDGKTKPDAYVNFAEHHGPVRTRPKGDGFICPSTLPGNPHGCDQNRCDRCFRPVQRGGER